MKKAAKRKVLMRQGNEKDAGAKHSIYRHYGTKSDYFTAEEILSIPDIIANGVRKAVKRGKKQLYEYTLKDNNGVRFIVLTEINNRGEEVFDNFYTDRKALSTARLTTESSVARRTGKTNGHTNTQSSAQADIDNADSGAKLQKVSDSNKEETDKIFDTAKRRFGTMDDAATQTQHTETRFSLPSEAEDVSRGDQLFLFDDGMMESSGRRYSLPEEDRKVSSAHDAMSRKGLREIVGEEGYDAFLDDVGRRLRDDVKKEVSSSVGREFLDDVLVVATNAQHTGRGRSYEERRRDAVGLTIGLLLERIW